MLFSCGEIKSKISEEYSNEGAWQAMELMSLGKLSELEIELESH